MRRIFFSLVAVAAAASMSVAGTGLAFLEIPVGARESALGGCGASLVTGPTSAAYNPAVVAFTPRSVAVMHNRHFADTRAEFIGFTVRHGRLALSPHYLGTRVSDIEFRDQPTREPVSTFDAVHSAAGTALAAQFGSHYSVGVTGRYLYQKIHIESSDGWAMDAGVIARGLLNGLDLGMAVQHVGKMSKFVSEAPELPTALRGGAAYERALSKYGSILLCVEAQAVRDNTPLWRGGIEYRAPGYVALRAGFVEGLETQDVSLGVGFFVRHYRLDYAFIPYRENLGEGHRFSLAFDL